MHRTYILIKLELLVPFTRWLQQQQQQQQRLPHVSSVHRGLVENDGVLLVVPGVGGDSNDTVNTSGQLREPRN